MSAPVFKVFDVRPVLARGEEPFGLIRTKVDALLPGHGLIVIAPFMPAPLIEILQSEGFRATVEHQRDGAWAVKFWRE